ncbi:hypothetical protein CC56_4224, partial [Bordetella pertussis H934]
MAVPTCTAPSPAMRMAPPEASAVAATAPPASTARCPAPAVASRRRISPRDDTVIAPGEDTAPRWRTPTPES